MSTLKENAAIFGAVLATIVIICGMFWASFAIKRWWNYSMGYESKVTETVQENICEMVKPEYLSMYGIKICKEYK